jgi:serine phosphatase RsbU (regulator of sigma subunit)
MKKRPLVIAAILAGAIAVERALAALVPEGVLHDIAAFILVGASVVAVFLSLRWLWRKATYRVGARLFWSYLLIGLVPFALLALLSSAALYMLVGQYASVRFGDTLERCDAALARLGEDAARALDERGPAAAAELLGAAQRTPPEPLPRLEWVVADGERRFSSSELGLTAPLWTAEGAWSGALRADRRVYEAFVRRSGARVVACLLPFDLDTAKRFSKTHWFEVRLTDGRVSVDDAGEKGGGFSISLADEDGGGEARGTPAPGSGLTVGGERVSAEEVESRWRGRAEPGGGPLGKPWVLWFRLGPRLREWGDGSEIAERRSVALLRTSALAAWRDFSSSKSEGGGGFLIALKVIGATCAVLYAIAVAIAAAQILTITRSTARLSRGAREVARGNLDHRIPVKRRDQLGDLAVSFNHMTDSVREMLAEVAAKEHLARELELAREIQEGLLPLADARYGDLGVFAHFRPATEVGGDYFDVIPAESGRLIVAVGDVAGHGVSTGLLMAMVKSAVATLVREERAGVDLLERVNTLMLDNPRRHRTATLLLVDIDTRDGAGAVRLASAGHPPAFLVAPGGMVTEALLSSLPLGHPWPDRPGEVTLPFAPGSRLVVYSDGLVEAQSTGGAALGYDGLGAFLRRHATLGAGELLVALLGELDRHVGERPLADDLTVVIVERAARPAGDGVTA